MLMPVPMPVPVPMMFARGEERRVRDRAKVIGRGVVNAVGLFILVAFLGYGLVEVPRELWNKGDTEGQLRYLKFKVAVQSDELQQVSAGRPHPRAARSHST